MRGRLGECDRGGFVLVLTLVLLALLVLAVYALSSLVRVDGQVATASFQRRQARQHALLGLQAGMAELQRLAGPDDRVTGMAGITGIAPNRANTTRHWCGVWRQGDGVLLGWLASGAPMGEAAMLAGTDTIELVGAGSVGSAAADSEHVIARKLPIRISETPATPGVTATVGAYAWLVSDEGVKTPVYTPSSTPVVPPVIYANTSDGARVALRDAVASNATLLPKLLSYEQLRLLPMAAGDLNDSFHSATLASRSVTTDGVLQPGFVTINSNSVDLWRDLLRTYEVASGRTIASLSTRGTSLQNRVAAYSGPGKGGFGPFTTLDAVEGLINDVLPANVSPTAAEIAAVLRVRSDTFRLRGYGEAVNPVDPARVAAVAQCEALVQRTTDPSPDGTGRKFVVIYFRWLATNDL